MEDLYMYICISYGRFINQFPSNIIRSIRQFERINKKMSRQKCLLYLMKYVLMKKCCQNIHTYIHTYTHIYIYIYICVCVYHHHHHHVVLLAQISSTLPHHLSLSSIASSRSSRLYPVSVQNRCR